MSKTPGYSNSKIDSQGSRIRALEEENAKLRLLVNKTETLVSAVGQVVSDKPQLYDAWAETVSALATISNREEI